MLHKLRRRYAGLDPGLARTEGMLFKFGSGTGSNLSAIRSSKEGLTGGGQATGPLSFMRGFDAFAGLSAVVVRRAALRKWSF